MGDFPNLPLPPIVPPDTYADQTPPTPVIPVDTRCVQGPSTPLPFANETADQFARQVAAWLCSIGAPFVVQHAVSGLLYGLASGVTFVLAAAARLIAPILAFVVSPVLIALHELRTDLDPQASQLAVDVLGELLGTSFNASLIATGSNVQAHLQNAQALGSILHTQLASEFANSSTLTPQGGQNAAERFSGLAINFGMATGLLGFLGGLCPELRLEEAREIGEQVARALGLGRMAHRAIQPLIDIVVRKPYTWFLNEKYLPEIYTLGEAVNPFAQSTIGVNLLVADLTKQGYDTAHINALLKLHEKQLSLVEVEALVRYRAWTPTGAAQYLESVGWDPGLVDTAFQTVSLARADKYISTAITQFEAEYAAGVLDEGTFDAMLQALPIDPIEYNIVKTIADAKVAKHLQPRKVSPKSAYDYCYENNLIDLATYISYLESTGLTGEDLQVLLLEAGAKLNKNEATAAAKAAKAAAAAAKAAAAATAAQTPAPSTSASGAQPVTPAPPVAGG